MALDEATLAFLEKVAKAGHPALHEQSVERMRELNLRLTPLLGEGPPMASVVDRRLGGDQAPFTVRVFTPAAKPAGTLVYYHGGGWVLGSLAGFDTLCRQLAHRTGMTVILVAYRRAPEHPYPAAVEDAWTALRWAVDNRSDAAGEGGPLVVGGDSAGGNLAAVVAQRAAREGGPAIDLQVLIYPVTAADFDTSSYRDPANVLFLTREAMVAFWDYYLPDEEAREDWAASPLRGEVAGTAPAVVLLAEHDVVLDDGAAYARKLRAAGVTVREHVVEGQMHGFFTHPNLLPGAATGMDLVVDAIDDLTETAA